MVHYQSIPVATHHANVEPDDTVKINKSIVVRRIVGSVMILFVGLGVIATNTYPSDKSIIIIAGTPVSSTLAAPALLHSTTTTVAGAGCGDHCCAPATGTWDGQTVGGYNDLDDAYSRPYETCYYNCDTAALKALVCSCHCWSKSYYDGDWNSCTPAGGRPWQKYNQQKMLSMYLDPDTEEEAIHLREQENRSFFGTPCQDFDKSVSTCSN